MKLLNLKASNIFSLDSVELSLDRRGILLVTGHSIDEGHSNGAGKSSLANKPIVWGLFGQTAGGLKGDDVINRHINGTASVEITFLGNDGKEYLVVRTRNPNSLSLFQNGANISNRTEKETQLLIEKVLGRTIDTFLQTDFFGQGKPASFLAIPAKDQKEIIENILPLDKLSTWAENARKLKAEIDQQIREAEMVRANLLGKKEELDRSATSLSLRFDNWEKEKQSRLANIQTELAGIQESVIATQNKITELKLMLVIYPTRDSLLKTKTLTTDQTDKDQIDLIHQKSVQTKITTEIEMLLKSKLKLKRLNSSCPTCGSVLDVEKANRSVEIEHAKLDGEIEVKQQELDDLEATILFNTSKYNERLLILKSITDTLYKIEKTESDLKALEGSDYLVASKSLHIEKETLERSTNPYLNDLNEVKNKVEYNQIQIQNCSKDIDILIERSGNVSSWANIFSKNFYAYVLNRACPFLEDRTAKHLEGLRNGQIKVKFNTLKALKSGDIREEFNITVSSDTGGEGFDSLSGGEQQMVSFAVGLALSDLVETQVEGKSHQLILDEPFVELDSKNQEAVITYLQTELSKTKETILMISNDEYLKSLVPNIVTVIKENGISRIQI